MISNHLAMIYLKGLIIIISFITYFVIINFSTLMTFLICEALADACITNLVSVAKINLCISFLFLLIYIAILALTFIINNERFKSYLITPGILFIIANVATIVLSTIAIAINIDLTHEFFIYLGVYFYIVMLQSFIFFIELIIYNEDFSRKSYKIHRNGTVV